MIKNAFYRLSFLFFLYLLFYFCLDPVLRLAAVWAAQSAIGAKVEIGRLRTGFFPPRLELKSVAAADSSNPMKNLFEFERASFRLEGKPLLEKKFIVSEASVTGIRLGTDRKSSGALPKRAAPSWAQPGAEMMDQAKSQASQFTLERVSPAKEDLKSLALLEEMRGRYGNTLAERERTLKEAGFDKRVDGLQQRLKSLKSGSGALAKIKQFQETAEEAEKLAREAKGFEENIRQDLSRFQEDVKLVQAAQKKDVEDLMSRLSLGGLDSESLSRLFLGPEMSAKAAVALDWISWARAHMGSSSKPPPPKRGEGLTVAFKSLHSYPSWAVREMKISGPSFEGKAAGITSQPALLGDPAEIKIHGTLEGSKLSLRAFLDHRKEPATDSLEFSYLGMAVGPLRLGQPDSIELRISSGLADLKGRVSLEGDSLQGRISFGERGISVVPGIGPKGGGEMVRRAVEGALRGLDRFEAELELRGTLKSPEWSVRSSLGRIFSEGLKKSLGREAEAQRKALEAKVQSLVESETGSLKQLLSRISAHQDVLKGVQKSPIPKPDLKKLFQ